jgi:hypothetical protein
VVQFRDSNIKRGLSYGILFLGMIATSYLSALQSGAHGNVLLPVNAAVSILLGLAIHTLAKKDNASTNSPPNRSETVIYAACFIQFALLLYNPFDHIPTTADALAGQKIVAKIAKVDGEVLLPRHGYLLHLADKKSYAHELAVSNVLRGRNRDARAALVDDLSTSIKENRFAAIIVDYNWLGRDIDTRYMYSGRVFDDPKVFWPVSGNRTRPKYMYVPKDAKQPR